MANEEKQETKVEENAEEGYVMLSDLIKEQEELEDQSIAVYGASDDKFCSYDNGYLKRQALFSCLTCTPKTTDDLSHAAGICLACSYKCHENHKLIELYTKRNFRCDCGTYKMPDSQCNLTKTKEGKLPINRDNIYNHNFQGLYCTCNRPYPDPDNEKDDDIMAQCNICEDWFHYGHLNTSIPENADTYDLICEKCVKDNDFLQYYHKYSTQVAEKIASESDDKLRSDLDKSISDILNIETNDEAENPPSKKAKLEEDAKKEEASTSTNTSNNDCTLPSDKAGYVDGAMFLPSSWRELLCKCAKCKDMYEDKKMAFLLDPDDCQRLYEKKGIEKTESALESTIENLSATNRVALVETIHEFHNMAGKLKEFLAPFMGSEKVVTQDDINRFFEEMKNNRSKSSTQPSTFCR